MFWNLYARRDIQYSTSNEEAGGKFDVGLAVEGQAGDGKYIATLFF
jgi:hypothetical protein